MKVLILWSGAVVPAYRQFFLELSKHMRVRVLAPKSWTHGSVAFQGGANSPSVAGVPTANETATTEYEFRTTAYLPKRSSRYWVPALILHLWSFRPRFLYIMDEMDRPSLTWHALSAKIAWPPVQVVCYALQNLPAPAYYRWHHRMALGINRLLISRGIAASEEAEQVLKAHGFRGATRVIPLWGSENFFYPGEPLANAEFRHSLGIPENTITLLYSGSLVEAKGLLLLIQVLPRFPHIHFITAGHGPLEDVLREKLGKQWTHLGGLEGNDLRRFYQIGEYIILPSLTLDHWKEQVGRSLIEGVLCGCIALGSDSGHIPTLTQFPETTFSQGDQDSLAAMLARLPLPAANSIRIAQRQNVSKRFTAAAVALETFQFLGEDA